MNLSGNHVLITGGNSGIGLALAEMFYHRGNKVIITGRNSQMLKMTKIKLPDIHYYECELSSSDSLEGLISSIYNDFPQLNILINNAAVQYYYRFSNGTAPKFSEIDYEFSTNLLAPIKLSTAFIPLMLKTANSAIINVTSSLVFAPKESAPGYVATKMALRSFTQSLRWQLAKTNIKIFELIPPLTDTHMARKYRFFKKSTASLADEFADKFKRDVLEMKIGNTKIIKLASDIFPGITRSISKKMP